MHNKQGRHPPCAPQRAAPTPPACQRPQTEVLASSHLPWLSSGLVRRCTALAPPPPSSTKQDDTCADDAEQQSQPCAFGLERLTARVFEMQQRRGGSPRNLVEPGGGGGSDCVLMTYLCRYRITSMHLIGWQNTWEQAPGVPATPSPP